MNIDEGDGFHFEKRLPINQHLFLFIDIGSTGFTGQDDSEWASSTT